MRIGALAIGLVLALGGGSARADQADFTVQVNLRAPEHLRPLAVRVVLRDAEDQVVAQGLEVVGIPDSGEFVGTVVVRVGDASSGPRPGTDFRSVRTYTVHLLREIVATRLVEGRRELRETDEWSEVVDWGWLTDEDARQRVDLLGPFPFPQDFADPEASP